jgi:hypothetical protein
LAAASNTAGIFNNPSSDAATAILPVILQDDGPWKRTYQRLLYLTIVWHVFLLGWVNPLRHRHSCPARGSAQ